VLTLPDRTITGPAQRHRDQHHDRPSRRHVEVKAAAWAAALLALSALTLLVPSQPGYDAWAWLVWGRELAALDLDTVQGPAFKPLPVAVTALASGLGDGAPALWLAIARAGALAAVALAARLAWRLGGGSWPAAAVAGAGVALSAGWWWHAAVGNAEGLFLALVLAALHQELDRRHGRVLALGFTASLLRPEAWPFLGVYGVWRWWRDPALRPWLAAAAAALPVLWLGPELVGSGDLMRSSQRAQIPNPGAPALAPRPALESLARARGRSPRRARDRPARPHRADRDRPDARPPRPVR